MNVITHDLNRHRGGVKVLELQFTHAAAVDGVSPARIECRDIKMLRPFTHLFIRRKGDADIAVGNILRF